MVLIVIITNQTEHMNSLLEFLLEQGVPGATVLHSEGMGKLVSADAPLFARFGHKFTGVKPQNRTVLSVVESEEVARRILRALRRERSVAGKGGIAFSVPLSEFVELSAV
jgi:nitrogen regulatory protein P-II 1